MIDHFTLTVSDIDRSKRFYTSALAPLGYKLLMDFGEYAGFGDHKPYFWLKKGSEASRPMHIAFEAKSRAAVDAFHAAALAAGARDDGRPGVREMYHPNYYGAFVIEVDGHPIEAVCHSPPARVRKTAPRHRGGKGGRRSGNRMKTAPTRKKRR